MKPLSQVKQEESNAIAEQAKQFLSAGGEIKTVPINKHASSIKFVIDQKRTDFCSEFLRGQSDCDKGIEHKAGMSDAYNRGYSTQYEREQILSELTQ